MGLTLPPVTIQILCIPKVFDAALHIVNDTLRMAVDVTNETDPERALRLELVTMNDESIETGSGQSLKPTDSISKSRPDWVVVPGFSAGTNVGRVIQVIKSAVAAEAIEWLNFQYGRGARIATACTGAWLIAEAGLLDGLRATTTWYFSRPFQERYPKVKLEPNKVLIIDQGIHSTGAAMAHMDLTLSLLTSVCSAEISHQVASVLLLDSRPSQSQYMIGKSLSGSSEDLRRIDSWVRSNLSKTISVALLARSTGFSTRTLARRIKDATGETPIQFIRRIRVEHAIYLLKTTPVAVEEVARRVGYQDAATLRRLIQKKVGFNPSQLRSGYSKED